MGIVNSLRIFCAIDTSDYDEALNLAKSVTPLRIGIKIGLGFYSKHGPLAVKEIVEKAGNPPLFLDLKFHDIPNTVYEAVRSIVHLHPKYINVHASGGTAMMEAAREAAVEEAKSNSLPVPKILGVTVLTSLDSTALSEVGQTSYVTEQVERLAQLTKDAGLDGVVCSAHEISIIREACGENFILMVPGIRPATTDTSAEADDQKRTKTPIEALKLGANHLVIGRPITKAKIPVQAAQSILDEIQRDTDW